jgi:hypothetical protein
MAHHDGERPEPGFESNRRILKGVGYAAAAAFCAVSVCANLRYGLSLGKNPTDKATYATASVAADVFKMAAPLLALSLWERRFRVLGVMGLVLWLACLSWSMASAAGFVLSSRGRRSPTGRRRWQPATGGRRRWSEPKTNSSRLASTGPPT